MHWSCWRPVGRTLLALLLALGVAGLERDAPETDWPSIEVGRAMATAEAVEIGLPVLPLSPLPPVTEVPLRGVFLSPAHAQAQAPFVELGALTSAEGETFDTFLVRVAQAMDLFSRRTSHEACGVIQEGQNPQRWRVRLTTNRSHLACVMVLFDEPGFKPLREDIHSHPRVAGGTYTNARDVERNRAFACNQRIVVFDERFSEKDLDRGPGYLVSRGRLLFQRGRAYPFQLRAAFEPVEEMPALTFGSAGLMKTAQPDEKMPALAEAVWANTEAEGLLPTACEEPSQSSLPANEQKQAQ